MVPLCIVAGVALFLALVAMLCAFDAYDKATNVEDKLEGHGHRMSPGDVGTKDKPAEQLEINMERLMAAVQGLVDRKALDVNTLKGLLDAADES